ncbi:MAG: V-type ATPase subunit [Planctomycetota bacterium]
MWSTDDYDFINAKVHGMRSRLYEDARLAALLNCSNLTDLLQSLYPGRRRAFMDDVSVEKFLTEQYFDALTHIRHYMSGRSSVMVETILLRRTVENCKVVIQFWHQQKQGEPLPGEIGGYLVEDPNIATPAVKPMLDAEAMPDLVAKLPLQGLLPDLPDQMKAVFERYEKDHIPFYIFAALDRAYHDLLWESVQALRRGDRRVAVRVIGAELDAANILAALRLRFTYGLPMEETLPLLSAHGHLLNAESLELMCQAEGADGLIHRLPAEYKAIFVRAHGDLRESERLFWDHLYRMANRIFYQNMFNIGAILGFYVFKKIEFMNLARVIQGFRYELPASDIRRELIPLGH